ncbi:MAG TPA: hypothetical protein VGQ06_08715 [Gemmatimonadales bacterium]|jgi:uncharacterized membrane protein YozB (DUF420 family)|nr:hypothetical protein [Gemmatimonadales bacterium]
MSAPWQAYVAIAWALVGPPLLVYAATRVRRAQIPLHATLMITAVVVSVGVLVSFGFVAEPSPRRAALMALPLFKIHLAFAFTALAGMAWQLTSRGIPRLRALHRHTGPYVVFVWCLTLITGIYNFVFLYVMGSP